MNTGVSNKPLPDFRYRVLSGLPLVKSLLRSLRFRLLNSWCIWRGACGSFLGHIRTQSAKERLYVRLGPALVLAPDRTYQADTRTLARRLYMEKLLAIYPWVDIPDLRIFLMGFDAGEGFAHSRRIPVEQNRSGTSCDQLSQVPGAGTDASSQSVDVGK